MLGTDCKTSIKLNESKNKMMGVFRISVVLYVSLYNL